MASEKKPSTHVHLRTAEAGRQILKDNRSVLYHLPRRYNNLHEILVGDLRADLFKILTYLSKIDPIIYKQKYVYFLPNSILTDKIRKKTTGSVSNRRLNYLCCIGLIRKVRQTAEDMIGINMEFLLENPHIKTPMSVVTIYRYTDSQLEKMNDRAGKLLDAKVTVGNLSHDRLMAAGLQDLADEVYYLNRDEVFYRRQQEIATMFNTLDQIIAEKGYASKRDLYRSLPYPEAEIDKLLKIFKNQFQERYSYKRHNSEERDKWDISGNGWKIMTRQQ